MKYHYEIHTSNPENGSQTIDSATTFKSALKKLGKARENDPATFIDKWDSANMLTVSLTKAEGLEMELFDLREASTNLLYAIADNCEPITGTTGVSEDPTGSFIREQFISEEIQQLGELIGYDFSSDTED